MNRNPKRVRFLAESWLRWRRAAVVLLPLPTLLVVPSCTTTQTSTFTTPSVPSAIEARTALGLPAQLARRLQQKSEDREAVLIEVFTQSGIPIVNDQGIIINRRNRVFGIPIQLVDLRALAHISTTTTTLIAPREINSALELLPEFSLSSVSQDLNDLFAETATNSDSQEDFLSNFLRASRAERASTASDDSIDLISLHLILYRLISEVATLADSSEFVRESRYRFEQMVLVAEPSSAAPCSFEGPSKYIVSTYTSGTKKIFKKLLDYLAGHGVGGAATYKIGTKIVQPILTYLKLAVAVSAVELSINEDGLPIRRTRYQLPSYGSRARFDGKLTYNLGNIQYVNCLNLALANAGVTFSVPSQGPARGGNVTVRGQRGFGLPSGSEEYLKWAPNTTPAHIPAENGSFTVLVDGAAQPRNRIIPDNARQEFRRVGQFRIFFELKKANIFNDLISASGTYLNIPAEMLSRSGFLLSWDIDFPVLDWITVGDQQFGPMQLSVRTNPINITSTYNIQEGRICRVAENKRRIIYKIHSTVSSSPAQSTTYDFCDINDLGDAVSFCSFITARVINDNIIEMKINQPGNATVQPGPPAQTELTPADDCEEYLGRWGSRIMR